MQKKKKKKTPRVTTVRNFFNTSFFSNPTQSYLLGHVAQILGLQHGVVEVSRGAGQGSSVGLRAEGPEGEADITAAPPLPKYIHKLLLILQARSARVPVLKRRRRAHVNRAPR